MASLFDQPALPGLWGDAEDYDTRMIVERMRRNQAYENSLFGRIADWLGRQQEWFEGASAFNPIAMALEGAQIANRWAGSPAFPERVQQGDMLAPLGLGAMAAPFAVRGAIGSAGGKLRPANPLAEGSASGDPRVVGGTAGRTEMLSEDPSVSRVTAYHGSPNTFALFDEETVPWFSTSERTAERFGADRASNAYHHNASSLQRLKNAGKLHLYRADIEGRILDNDPMAEAAIIAREIGVEEPKTWDEVAELLQWADYQTQIINDARRQGFDAVRFRNVGDDPVGAISDHIAVLNPQAIKNFTQLYADQSRSSLPGTVINAAAEGSRNDRKWRKATNER